MEMWQTVMVNKWRRLDNAEVMGYEVARKAGELADFFESLEFVCYDTYSTKKFSRYAEAELRGFQTNEGMYDEMHIATTLDLHTVTCTSYGLHEFDHYMSERWRDYFMFAYRNGI